MRQRTLITGLKRFALMGGLLALLACTPIIRNHGFIPPPEDLAQVQIGADTRESVREKLGPPTTDSAFDDSDFYYVASQFRHFGALAPEEIAREVLAVSFDANGNVANIERFGLSDGRVIALSRRVTDSGVGESPFLRQLFGSFGQINAGDFLGES